MATMVTTWASIAIANFSAIIGPAGPILQGTDFGVTVQLNIVSCDCNAIYVLFCLAILAIVRITD